MKALEPPSPPAGDAPIRVIGVGNSQRGDDAAGLRVARLLKGNLPEGIEVLECPADPLTLIHAWEGAQAVYIVDAMQSGAPPGHVCVIDATDEFSAKPEFHCSTHGLGVAEAIGFSRAMGTLPRHVMLIGIEGAEFTIDRGLSPAVQSGVEEAARLIARSLKTNLTISGGE